MRHLCSQRVEVADLESLKPVASMEVSLEQRTNESSDCQVPGLVLPARAVADHLVVPVSQVLNLALVNLAMGHEVLHEVVPMEAAYILCCG